LFLIRSCHRSLNVFFLHRFPANRSAVIGCAGLFFYSAKGLFTLCFFFFLFLFSLLRTTPSVPVLNPTLARTFSNHLLNNVSSIIRRSGAYGNRNSSLPSTNYLNRLPCLCNFPLHRLLITSSSCSSRLIEAAFTACLALTCRKRPPRLACPLPGVYDVHHFFSSTLKSPAPFFALDDRSFLRTNQIATFFP